MEVCRRELHRRPTGLQLKVVFLADGEPRRGRL
jgi:hypothetical protein